MCTQVATPIAYPIFNTPPRLCGLPTFSIAPRQKLRRLSLPPVSVLVEPTEDTDESDDEGNLLSYHSLRMKAYERIRAPSPDDVDYLEKKKLVMPSSPTAVPPKKPMIDTGKKWDYYVAPLSPLSDLTESEASDSDNDIRPELKPTTNDEASKSPRTTPQAGVYNNTPAGDPPSPPSSTLVKRKRSCDSGFSSTSQVIDDSEGPPNLKRRRVIMSGTRPEKFCEVGKAESSSSTTTTRPRHHHHPLSMSRDEIKKSIRRNARTFGTVRKPRVFQTAARMASFGRREVGASS